jgi:hypothetical protein
MATLCVCCLKFISSGWMKKKKKKRQRDRATERERERERERMDEEEDGATVEVCDLPVGGQL